MEGPDRYDEYLLRLQQKNRVLKQLKAKDDEQIELERKEQGFSLYVNGANDALKSMKYSPRKPTATKPKTAGEGPRRHLIGQMTEFEMASEDRAKTAPSKLRRRNWQQASVDIKTNKGSKVKLKSTAKTADYSEDFEVDNSLEAGQCWQDQDDQSDDSEREEDLEHIHKNMTMILEAGGGDDDGDDENSDLEVDADKYDDDSSEEGEVPEQLLLSLEDVKNLRRSLEASAEIRQSIGRQGDDSRSGSSSEDDIEEELEEEDDEAERRMSKDITPGDMIVLDFGGPEHEGSHQNKHHLAAKRKPNTEEVSLESSHGITPFNQSVDSVVCLSATPTPRSSRPLSSQRKVEKLWNQEDDLTVIQRAIQAENSALSARLDLGNKRELSQPDEVPPKAEDAENSEGPTLVAESSEGPTPEDGQQVSECPPVDTPPPDLMTSQNLNEYKMDMVVDKVKHMDARSQKKLLRQLGKLEESTSPQRSPKKMASTTAVPTATDEEMALFSTPKLAPRAMSAVTPRSPQAPTITDVTFEILSNWGHPSRVGLTELEFCNNIGERIPLTPTDVWVRGAKNMQGMLGNLVNGRTKTTREKNMWSCSLVLDQPIILHFKVRQGVDRDEEAGKLIKIRIWNYNKSLRDLNVGVKNARLLLGKDVIWEGIVEKGCGNQVFDYSSSVEVPCTMNDRRTMSHDSASPRTKDSPRSEGNVPKGGKTMDHESQQCPGSSQDGRDMSQIACDSKEIGPNSLMEAPMSWATDDELTIHNISGGREGEQGNKTQNESTDNSTPQPPMPDLIRSKTKILKRSALQSDDSIEEIVDASKEGQENVVPHESAISPTESSTTPDKLAADMNESGGSEYVRDLSSGEFGCLVQSSKNRKSVAKGRNTPERELGYVLTKKSAELPDNREGASGSRYSESLLSSDFECLGELTTIVDQPNYERSKTRLLTRSTDNLPLPTVDDSIQIFASPRVSMDTSKEHNHPVITAAKNSTPSMRDEKLGNVSERVEELLPSLEVEDFNQEEMSMLQQLQNLSVAKKETPKPSWLINEKAEQPSEDEPLFGMETFPPKTSTGSVREGTPVADDLEDVRWRQVAQGSVEGHQDAPHSSAEPSRRAQWRNQRQLSLEESWTSLSMFDKSQKGRLTANMNMDVAGDSLDDYLNQRHLFEVQEDTKDDDSSDEFEIPVLPHGQRLKILIKTSWGDKHYVGLNGIEVFLSNGELAPIAEITADPPDINILEEYNADPRVVSNLVDGINCTRDDIHMWLAPHVQGQNSLQLTFAHPVKIAMIRIWNYNKSRIHSFRGAKDIEIFMGERCIFKGEIDRASGAREGDMEAFGDTILFTEDEDILDLISKHDEAYIVSQTEDWFSSSMEDDLIPERPKTAGEGEERPFTTARKFRKKKSDERETSKSRSDSALIEGDVSPVLEERYIPSAMEGLVSSTNSLTVFNGRCLKLVFTATWGDYYYLGLTGLEVMGPDGGSIAFSLDQMDAEPRDLNILSEYGSDDRTLDKIIDGENITTSDEHMWMIPFSEGEDHTLTIDLRDKVQLSGLRIWNYNKNPEDTYRGARTMHVYLDSCQLSPKNGFLIRKGPGNCFFDYAQEINFLGTKKTEPSINQALPKTIQESLRSSIVASEEPSQEYISMHMPCGFVFQFQLLCTWGDQYYVGLNGIEFYDETGRKIALTETNVAAYPPSINVLEGVNDDMRTPDKLIDSINDSKDGRHTWLAPILPGVINRVYVVFDEPVAVSMIKLWNYSKTPHRGVKEFGLYLDDLLIYNGILGQVSTGARGILPTIELPASYYTILFTDDVELLKQEKHTIIQNRSQDQDVQMTNDREVVEKHSTQKAATTVDQALRPKTSIAHGMRAGAIRR